MRLRSFLFASTLLAALPCLGCRNLDRFDTQGKGAYCGDLVRGPSFQDGIVVDDSPGLLRLLSSP